eukprot:5161636-Pyramimonas_sp.AAC.1
MVVLRLCDAPGGAFAFPVASLPAPSRSWVEARGWRAPEVTGRSYGSSTPACTTPGWRTMGARRRTSMGACPCPRAPLSGTPRLRVLRSTLRVLGLS